MSRPNSDPARSRAFDRNQHRIAQANKYDLEVIARSQELRDLPVTSCDSLIRLCRTANHRTIMDAKQEESWEKRERAWRRWQRFTELFGLHNPYLDSLPDQERRLLAKCFVVQYRDSHHDKSGKATKKRTRPMVVSTLRDAIGHVAATFRASDRPSPFHLEDGPINANSLRTEIKELLKAFTTTDLPPNRQKAITAEFLRDVLQLTATMGIVSEHAADLIAGAFFFAMRACEFCLTPKEGKTKRLTLGNITFRDRRRRKLTHTDPNLLDRAYYVTICFVDQKNGKKMDRRTQRRSRNSLCPIRAWARVCQRTRATVLNVSDSTPVCTIGDSRGASTMVTSTRVLKLLRFVCKAGRADGKFYGFEPHELGTKSICSGAAMALSIMNHSPYRIQILGRWSSDAFLVYIRPQVLEWTNIMAEDMARAGHLTDLNNTTEKPQRNCQDDDAPGLGIFPRLYLGC